MTRAVRQELTTGVRAAVTGLPASAVAAGLQSLGDRRRKTLETAIGALK